MVGKIVETGRLDLKTNQKWLPCVGMFNFQGGLLHFELPPFGPNDFSRNWWLVQLGG